MFVIGDEHRSCMLRHARDDAPLADAYYKHAHQNYELLYFLEGDATYNIEGQVFHLHPHDLLVIQPTAFHFLRPLSDRPYERYCFNFDCRILPGENRERLRDLPAVCNIEAHALLRTCFTKLDDYAARFSEGDMYLMARLTLREILLNLLYIAPAAEERRMRKNAVVERIVALIDEHPEQDWNAERLAAALYLSPSYVQNLFSHHMEIGLKSYINQKKILYAQSLLLGGERPLAVCEACGFHEYSTFYRLYRRITGTAPSACE